MKKTLSTIFVALLIAGASSVKAQDTKVKGKTKATATDTKVGTATKAVAPKKMDKLVDPADSSTPQPKKAAVDKKELKKAAVKTTKAQPVSEPKKTKSDIKDK